MKLNTSVSVLTRPNDTTAYAFRDIITTTTNASTAQPFRFKDLANTIAGTGYITKARIWVQGAAFATPLRLHLFTSTPTMYADNAQYQLMYESAPTHIGFIDFASFITAGTGSDVALCEVANIRLAVRSLRDTGSNDIFGILTAQSAFTPTANQQFRVELSCDSYEF